MVAGHHLIWTAYGWWLPNDPRGSSSYEIRSAMIATRGVLHYGRKRIPPVGCIIRAFCETARTVLEHALLAFSAGESQIMGFPGQVRVVWPQCRGV